LVHELDGKTTGPTGFSGSIGKKLPNCEQTPVVASESVPSEEIQIDLNDLSTDQKYLLEIYQAVSSGVCDNALAVKNPGKMGHSRWLTTANRILRLYISEEEPSTALVDIVSYIMRVYVPLWFAIKKYSHFRYGAQHFHKMISCSRNLKSQTKKIVEKVLSRNAFFANEENILIAMICEERKHIRELGMRRILKARRSYRDSNKVRQFKVPDLKFESSEYYDMINWQSVTSEPPVTRGWSEEYICSIIESGESVATNIPDFPCHTQAVERGIKLVTEASALVSGTHSRDGLIRTRISNRNKIPKFETKRDFHV
jgi:hypothetical protein